MKNWLHALLIGAVAFPPSVLAQTPSHDASSGQPFSILTISNGRKPILSWATNHRKSQYFTKAPRRRSCLSEVPKNFHVPRHWHSANETITMIHGTFILKHDGSDERVALDQPGSFAWMPAKMIHEAWTGPDGEALYFITADGKFDINWAEDPAKTQ